jgi:hypothetical protein
VLKYEKSLELMPREETKNQEFYEMEKVKLQSAFLE